MPIDTSQREFDAFVRGRSPALLRSAYLLTGDQQLAEDLVQSALSRTHLAWRRLHQTSNAEAYTRRTMYHLQVSWWRRRAAERRVNRLSHEPEVQPDAADQVTRRLVIREALATLTPRQRAVIVLRFFEDRSVQGTANMLRCTEGTVKSQTSKALASLRRRHPNRSDFSEWSNT
ncbi:RNA polymerase sigma-70 factor (sigma-E family) [Stackebrandtia endophytica]|uniref:RNA polymerase sigma-70 factor (Sigma-E family) n=1 Tax=Stackebrandtia endophytica TaxID=1496996 RepID=A0A543AWK2_9ACTN|nr:SigE family RNA polymerase sigma factor [Stackebrandtia endophytica]TQL76953.1 RNA polymerase sigma-70 factor (sigma-E family) [Stackebrandtia endophytica]